MPRHQHSHAISPLRKSPPPPDQSEKLTAATQQTAGGKILRRGRERRGVIERALSPLSRCPAAEAPSTRDREEVIKFERGDLVEGRERAEYIDPLRADRAG